MTNSNNVQHRSILQNIARQAMVDEGLVPDKLVRTDVERGFIDFEKETA
jgi:hypothetical protein